MMEIQINWSEYFYKRIQLYTLSLLFCFMGFLSPLVNIRLLLSFVGIGFWLLAVSYGRYWKFKEG